MVVSPPKLRAPSFPRRLREGWETTRRRSATCRQLAAVPAAGRLVAAGVQHHFPSSVRLPAPDGHVTTAGGHRIAVGVFAVAFIMTPGVAHIAGWSHQGVGGGPG